MTIKQAKTMTTEQAIDAIRTCCRSALLLRLAGRNRWAFRFERDAVTIAKAHGLRVADVGFVTD